MPTDRTAQLRVHLDALAELVAECGTALVVDYPATPRRSSIAESLRTRGYGCTPWHVDEAASLIADSVVRGCDVE